MLTTPIEPRKALNKAYLKVKPDRESIERFKIKLISTLDQSNERKGESEEFHKNIISDFFKSTYYAPDFYINTKERNDLVIHNGKDTKSSVGVIIETKSPKNKSEMITREKINCKALQELVLYYLRERITHKNLEVRHLIATNLYEWFIFDAQVFDKLFAQNTELVRKFKESEGKSLSNTSTSAFYKDIAAPCIEAVAGTIEYTYVDIRKFEKPLRNNDKEDDRQLIALYKLFSPEHLLKLSFANDSNTLDKNFYAELLHIIGLAETKEGGKKIIGRNKEGQRNSASLLENAIIQLDSRDKLSRITNLKQFGDTTDERLFNVALELTITWVNRILFLKLLEAQLTAYHKGDKKYAFLNADKIRDYDDLDKLFFQVLAKKPDERNTDVQKLYAHVPYLNSSLFEPTEIEHQTLFISQLEDHKPLAFTSQTVLKDVSGKKQAGTMDALHYFFAFLDAYDFSSEGSEEIQEDNKRLINASVLGLIFEKINGYKDGSFFTPGFITMYMCRETIRRAVVQRFNAIKGWDAKDLKDIYNKELDIEEANYIVNSLRICDPAVGSGHFLVSALNEILAIKYDLKILVDKNGRKLKDYQIDVVNDELIVTDEDGRPFQYNPLNEESRRVQETLFHEKETIIENCLFGVDINPNSVKICRLRLWIELLKNAYYKGPDHKELETLPNIDINIKNGNSLISRFGLDVDLKKALKDTKWSIESYKNAVVTYRNAEDKEQKREMERLINDIKGNFRSEINKNDPKVTKLYNKNGELTTLKNQTGLFEPTKKEAAVRDKKLKALIAEIKKLDTEIEEIKSNKMYENAFEWRFEFPEVLDDDGNFIGFDVIIGNPPYIQLQKMGQAGADLQRMHYHTYVKTGDIYSLFYELGINILKRKGLLSFITSNKWMRAAYGESLRKYFVEQSNPLILIDFGGIQVFDTATVDTNIWIGEKALYEGATNACILDKDFSINNISDYVRQKFGKISFNSGSWVVLSTIELQIKNKIENIGKPLKDWDIQINYGIKTGFNEAFIINSAKRDELIGKCPKSEEIIRPILRGRDIKRYKAQWAGLHIITTFPSLKIDIEEYPAVKEHLLSFGYDRLRQTGDIDSRKKTANQWFEVQDSISYWEDFYKQKLIYPDIMRMPTQKEMLKTYPYFYLDQKNFFVEATNFIMVGKEIDLIYLFLSSDLGFYTFSKFYTGPQFDSTGFRYKKAYLDDAFIPEISLSHVNEMRLIINELSTNQESIERLNNIWSEALSLEKDEIEVIKSYKMNLIEKRLDEGNLTR
ncbi:Eco57I restriction-modification methylase domain-containing protein [Flavobacterium sp. DGU11]|uniref:site-specific DNA-methyltransferase (adenine-specific) n=1 Tax=Flavobacterium arundinis TaxID=3139143 RepID=A0ABU9HZU1_9FLAO